MKKKAIVIIIVIVIVILIAVAVYLFVKGGKKDSTDQKLVDPNNPIPTPTPTPTPSNLFTPLTSLFTPAPETCTASAFPLGIGSKGVCVEALQHALGITADGSFGPKTSTAVTTKGYVVPLSHTDFDKIIGKTPSTYTGVGSFENQRVPKFNEKVYALKKTIPYHYSGMGSAVGASYFPTGNYIGRVSEVGDSYLKILYTNTVGAPIGADGKPYTQFYIKKDTYRIG